MYCPMIRSLPGFFYCITTCKSHSKINPEVHQYMRKRILKSQTLEHQRAIENKLRQLYELIWNYLTAR